MNSKEIHELLESYGNIISSLRSPFNKETRKIYFFKVKLYDSETDNDYTQCTQFGEKLWTVLQMYSGNFSVYTNMSSDDLTLFRLLESS